MTERDALRKMSSKELMKLYREYDDLCYGENACFSRNEMEYLEKINEELDRREEAKYH